MYKALIDKLENTSAVSFDEYLMLIRHREEIRDYAAERACNVRNRIYGNKVFIRGLIEISSYCKNDCYYCGLRAANQNAERYRLSAEQILHSADAGYALGFRTFVLQGGEDPYYTDDVLCAILREIKRRYPDCAVTLSLGERSSESYAALKAAGADRYLLRHETCNPTHYKKLHPSAMSFAKRQRCITDLKRLGYQVGVGFMVGSPFQTDEDLANELLYLKQHDPQMVGIGPFIPAQHTPFGDYPSGTAELTTFLLSLIRLTLPRVLLPATTALGTIDATGREKGIRAGANVVMPNLSPADVRGKYNIYDNKLFTGCEAAQNLQQLKENIAATGCKIVTDKGDYQDEL